MKLSVVVGTYNRLELLRKCITSIFDETTKGVKVYVTDAGSTDGTIEYLQSIASDKVVPILVGSKIGQARAYNDVFKIVDTPYVCWLSDDNIVVNRGLDTAVVILEQNPEIGMVGLKIKDLVGPHANAPYIGGISSIGILNVNQGVLPTNVLKGLGGFSEEFQDYGIDPDLTARVLFSGHKVVYTKNIAVLHHRNWAEDRNSKEYEILQEKHKRYYALYEHKYSKYVSRDNAKVSVIRKLKKAVSKSLEDKLVRHINRSSAIRDWFNVLNSRYISLLDLVLTAGKKYYLVQSLPKSERLKLGRWIVFLYENTGLHTCPGGIKENPEKEFEAPDGQASHCLYHRGRQAGQACHPRHCLDRF